MMILTHAELGLTGSLKDGLYKPNANWTAPHTMTLYARAGTTHETTLPCWPTAAGIRRGAAMVGAGPSEVTVEKMVVLPTVVARVVETSVTVLMIASVDTAVVLTLEDEVWLTLVEKMDSPAKTVFGVSFRASGGSEMKKRITYGWWSRWWSRRCCCPR